MSSATDETLIRDLLKNPKRFLLYALFVGIGWLGDRLIPNDCQREVARWQSLYYRTSSSKDSLAATKDALYENLLHMKQEFERHKLEVKRTDSLVTILGRTAESKFKKRHHGN